MLVKLAELMMKHRDELSLLETLDMGKPIANSRSADIPASAHTIQWYGEACDKVYDELAPQRFPISMITREPLGVVAAVVPWNFPLLMACWKIGPALAAGNSVILKPAEQSPLTAIRIAELAAEAGLPDGVLNVLPGYGETAGQALGRHMDVDMVAFTGSTEVGKLFLRYSGESNMKHVSLECGGKSPNIVFADVPDIDQVAKAAAAGVFYNSGQVCAAAADSSSTRRSRTSLSISLAGMPPNGRPAIRSIPRPPWARWLTSRRWIASSTISRLAARRAPSSLPAAARRVSRPAVLYRTHHLRGAQQRSAHRPGGDLRPGPHHAQLPERR